MREASEAVMAAVGDDAFRRVVEWAPTAMVLVDADGTHRADRAAAAPGRQRLGARLHARRFRRRRPRHADAHGFSADRAGARSHRKHPAGHRTQQRDSARAERAGITVNIDDFGTGYSSLGVLRGLPIDRIKIDRSFIVDLPVYAEGMAIVRAMVALGESLDMRIIVEGIERPEQGEVLARLGCGEGQGYLYSRAIAPDALRRWLADRTGG